MTPVGQTGRRPASRSGSILLVANYESDVGYAWWLMENFWHQIAVRAASDRRGCVLAYPIIRTIPDLIRQSPIETVELAFGDRSPRGLWAGLRLLRKYRITSVYLTDWPYIHVAYLLWRLVGVRRIVLHDHQPGDRPASTGLTALIKHALHGLRILSATRYVAVSPYVGRRLHVNACVPVEKCTVVTNGIRMLDASVVDRAAVRHRIDVPTEAILIVMVSRATYYKGLDFAVRCLSRLRRDAGRREAVYAVHCGDGPDLEAFEQLARELGVDDRFRFLGRRSDVWDILCAGDLAFHPSHGEAMSLAILECMSAGLPVVASDLPSVCTAIEHGVTGLTYRHEDMDAATAALRQVVDNPELRQSLGTSAAEACRSRYSFEAMNRTFVERVLPTL